MSQVRLYREGSQDRPRMPAVGGIEIISAAGFPGRLDELVRTGRPAVVTGLFDGQPIAAINSLAKARELVGGAPMVMSRNVIDSKRDEILDFVGGRKSPVEKQTATLAEYLDLAAQAPEARWSIAVGPAPAELLALADLSALGIATISSGYAHRDAPRSRDKAGAVLFAGNAGNAADLHTDWDGHDVLFYQVFGLKRVTLFPASAAPLLHPIGSFSTVRLSRMSDATRRDFLGYAGGVEHMLRPGETLFMPAFCWHNIEYVDLSLSISIRCCGIEDPEIRFPIGRLHQDLYLQNLMAAARDPAKAVAVRAAIGALRIAYAEPYGSARQKYRVLRELARAKCLELRLFDARHPRQTWIEFDDIVDGTECAAYHFLMGGSRLERWWWHNRERARSLVRRYANRVANWA